MGSPIVTRLFRRISVLAVAAAATAAMVPGMTAASAAAAVPAPTLVSPADNPTGNPAQALKDVVLTWTPITGASKYQVQVSPNGSWTNNTVTLPDSGQTVNAVYEMPLSLPHASYFWHVRARVGSTWSAYSASRTFLRDWSVPIVVTQTPTSGDPTLKWNPIQDASLYRVRFSTESDFPSDPKKTFTCWTSATSFTPYALQTTNPERTTGNCFSVSDLTTSTTYFWEVAAYDDSTAPVLVADTANDPAYECAETQPECDYPFTVSSFNFVAPAGGTVTTGVTGLSTTWRTATATTACNAASPASYCPVTPTFSWTPVSGANDYQVFVWRDPSKSNTYRSYETAWPELTPRDAYFDAQAGHSYYWEVVAGTCENEPGTDNTCQTSPTAPTKIASVVSATDTFNKSGGTVPLTAPANKALVAGSNPTFSWGDFQSNGGDDAFDAENYELQVATDSDFSNVVLDVPDIDMTRYTQPDALMADGNYFWRVAPIDESGNVLTWSATRQITVDDTAPKLSLTSKSGVSVSGPLGFKSSQSVTGVSSSTVDLTAANGAVVKGTVHATGSDTAWTFTPKTALVTGQTYQLKLLAGIKDDAGNAAVVSGSSVRTTTKADNSSKGWGYSTGWATHSASAAKGGSYRSAKKGKSAAINVVGKTATVYGCKGPSMGKLTLTVGGKAHSVNEHQSFTSCGVQIWHGSLPSGQVKITVKVAKSDGDIDELTVT
jgi:hypothetical protein